MDVDVREILGCTCLRMRRVTRRVTQIYDHALEGAGITANQFGLLGQLYGAHLLTGQGVSIGTLAERLGMDPTTLNRNLKPLLAKGLVRDGQDPDDARVRIVSVTAKGQRKLIDALPLWRGAQAQVEQALGSPALVALNDVLDLSAARLAAPK